MVNSSDNYEKKLIIEESPPSSVYSELSLDDSSYLIDVRTKPEWNFVGYPYIKNIKIINLNPESYVDCFDFDPEVSAKFYIGDH
mgnify:CR=1 FL=1